MESARDRYNRSHRAHDYPPVVRRWKKLAREAKLEMRVIAESGGFEVFGIRSKDLRSADHAEYISAGVHGDEPAPVTALLEWAEENVDFLRSTPLILFPCFNPWGIANNKREDSKGNDLNRYFQNARHPHIAGWRRFVRKQHFGKVICLHEDYDAQGIYVYRLGKDVEPLAECAMEAAGRVIPRDQRSAIDGSRAINGIIQRKRAPKNLGGLPEPLALLVSQADATMTFETPSEYGLYDRVRSHKAFLDAVYRGKR